MDFEAVADLYSRSGKSCMARSKSISRRSITGRRDHRLRDAAAAYGGAADLSGVGSPVFRRGQAH
jgi:hypothetical protein